MENKIVNAIQAIHDKISETPAFKRSKLMEDLVMSLGCIIQDVYENLSNANDNRAIWVEDKVEEVISSFEQ